MYRRTLISAIIAILFNECRCTGVLGEGTYRSSAHVSALRTTHLLDKTPKSDDEVTSHIEPQIIEKDQKQINDRAINSENVASDDEAFHKKLISGAKSVASRAKKYISRLFARRQRQFVPEKFQDVREKYRHGIYTHDSPPTIEYQIPLPADIPLQRQVDSSILQTKPDALIEESVSPSIDKGTQAMQMQDRQHETVDRNRIAKVRSLSRISTDSTEYDSTQVDASRAGHDHVRQVPARTSEFSRQMEEILSQMLKIIQESDSTYDNHLQKNENQGTPEKGLNSADAEVQRKPANHRPSYPVLRQKLRSLKASSDNGVRTDEHHVVPRMNSFKSDFQAETNFAGNHQIPYRVKMKGRYSPFAVKYPVIHANSAIVDKQANNFLNGKTDDIRPWKWVYEGDESIQDFPKKLNPLKA